MIKTFIFKMLPKHYRSDPYLNDIISAAVTQLSQSYFSILGLSHSNQLGMLSEPWLSYYEKLLGLTVSESATISDRRAAVAGRWRGAAQPTMALIQSICDSWDDGSVDVSYDYSQGLLTLTFKGSYGAPTGIDALKDAISAVIPAHIAVDYAYKYLKISEIHNVLTLDEMAEKKLELFAR